MSRARIEARLGPCRLVGPAILERYALRFHKRGRDGSGKCDAFFTGDGSDRLHGVVYELGPAQADRLDGFEGPDYQRRTVTVRTAGGSLASYAYVALASAIDPELKPYPWYREFVLAGAREAGFPAAYLAALVAVATVRDPDAGREAENLRILTGGL
jgi:hypothetical protein